MVGRQNLDLSIYVRIVVRQHMSQKTIVFLGMFIGSTIGGYIPTLFGAGILSYKSVFFSGVGGILGVWIGYKISNL